MWRAILFVGLGGFIGTVARYGLGKLIHAKWVQAFPAGTMVVNILGCFMIGLLYMLLEKEQWGYNYKLFLITGLCGGFTTFSAFSLDTFELIRTGQAIPALLYVAGSVVAGYAAMYGGMLLGK